MNPILHDGLWRNNPALVQMLGLCPLLAVSNAAVNGLALGLATTLTLIVTNTLISALRHWIRPEVRIPIYVVLIAATVTAIELAMNAWLHALYLALGLFIPLIVTNCFVIGRAETFAARHAIPRAALDGLANGIGFTAVLTLLGALRELLGRGTLLADIELLFGSAAQHLTLNLIPDYRGFLVMVLPPGAFFALALLIAAKNSRDARAHSRATAVAGAPA
jgi:electron transport complex protein RnfE